MKVGTFIVAVAIDTAVGTIGAEPWLQAVRVATSIIASKKATPTLCPLICY
jgi:hypothetical protein